MSIAAAEVAKDKGNAAFKAGDLPLALANYSTAIQLDPSSAVYVNNRALVHLKLKQFAKAEADATKAFNLDPTSAKALYRRGLARVGAGNKVDKARADFVEALQLGGGPEVKAELDKLPPPPATSSPPKPATPAPPPAATPAPKAQQSRTDRLRAALAQPELKPNPSAPANKGAIPAQPHTTPSGPSPALAPGELMKEVSTKRLTPAGGSGSSGGPNTFAKMKEQRQSRQGPITGTKQAAITTQTTSPQTPSISGLSPPATRTAVDSTSVKFELPTGDLSSLSIAERELAASPAWQSIAANPPPASEQSGKADTTDPRLVDTLPGRGSRSALDDGRGVGAPTTFAAFERRWLNTRTGSAERLELLHSLSPSNLPTVLGDSLSPDLLSTIVKTLASDEGALQGDEGWKVAFLRGLTQVRRFGMSVGFLDDGEKAELKAIFSRARQALIELEREWEL